LFSCRATAGKSTKDVPVVTINVGIFSRTVAQSEGNTHEPNLAEAHWWRRIGHYLPGGSDKWWTIHSQQEADLCAAEIVTILNEEALPEMRSLASTDKLKSLWEEGSSPGVTDYQRQRFLKALERGSSTQN
jgi:hypothetical protein